MSHLHFPICLPLSACGGQRRSVHGVPVQRRGEFSPLLPVVLRYHRHLPQPLWAWNTRTHIGSLLLRALGETLPADTHLKTILKSAAFFGCFSNSTHVVLMQELDSNGGGGGGVSSSGVGKRWLHSLDHYRRMKDEDPIIPFSEGPIISKWGAISRASRTGYHTTDPIQATACQGSANTTPINFKG